MVQKNLQTSKSGPSLRVKNVLRGLRGSGGGGGASNAGEAKRDVPVSTVDCAGVILPVSPLTVWNATPLKEQRQQREEGDDQAAEEKDADDRAVPPSSAARCATPLAVGGSASASAAAPRSVSFADEGGSDRPLTTFRLISRVGPDGESSASESDGSSSSSRRLRQRPAPGEGYVGTPPSLSEADLYWARFLVLLLCPETQQFEIVAIYHDSRERTSIDAVLRLVPKAATSPRFAGKRRKFVGLTRPRGAEAGTEMINALALADYGVRADEVLVAIPRGVSGRAVARMAEALLGDRRVEKLISRICRSESSSSSPPKQKGVKRMLMKQIKNAKRKIGKLTAGRTLLYSILAATFVLASASLVRSHLPDEWRKKVMSLVPAWVEVDSFVEENAESPWCRITGLIGLQ